MSRLSSMCSTCLVVSAVIVAGVALSCAPNPVSARADEEPTYDLRGPSPKKGTTFKITEVTSFKDVVIAYKGDDGSTLKGRYVLENTTEKEVEIIATEGRNVIKARIRLLKEESKGYVQIRDTKVDIGEIGALSGEIVVCERSERGWRCSLEKGKPTKDQEKELQKFEGPESDDSLFPEQKVRIGHMWDTDSANLRNAMGMRGRLNGVTGTVKSRFRGLEKIDDDLCAVIESDMDIGCRLGTGTESTNMKYKGRSTEYRSLKLATALQAKQEINLHLVTKTKIEGEPVESEIDGKVVIETRAKVVRP